MSTLPEQVEAASKSLPEAEWAARRAHGLPPYHLTAWDEYPFQFAVRERDTFDSITAAWCEAPDHLPIKFMFRAMARIAFADWQGVNAALAEYVRQQPTDRIGHLKLGEVPKAVFALPPVKRAWPKGPGFFFACDYPYLMKFGLPLLASFAHKAPGTNVHVHLMGAAAGGINIPAGVNITLTQEDCAAFMGQIQSGGREYYAAVRLCRFYEAMTQADGPLCLLDADGLVNNDPRGLFGVTGHDLVMRARPGRLEPWNQLAAATVLAFPTPKALAYLKTVSDIVHGSLERLWWGLDQFALLSGMLITGTRPGLFGPDVVDVDRHEAEALFWMTAGKAKYGAGDPADTSSYGRQYRHYLSALSGASGAADSRSD